MGKHKVKDPRRVNDYWTKKARSERYPARSVYKLEEIDRKYKLLRPGAHVLDLGAAPGSWLLYAVKRVGPSGRLIGVDLNQPESFSQDNISFIPGDVLDMKPEELAEAAPYDIVLSDMAPATTGIKTTDQARSLELCRQALALARNLLKNDGTFFVKIFQGPDVDDYVGEVKEYFQTVRRVKPKSSRDISPEFFILAMGYKGQNASSFHIES